MPGGPTTARPAGLRLSLQLLLVMGAAASVATAFLIPSPRAPCCGSGRASTRALAAAGADGASTTTPLSLQHQLQSMYPRVPLPPEFLSGVQPSDSGSTNIGAAADTERALVRARMFASLAPRALLARGLDIISEDFVYFSPSTGHLSRAEYMGLVSVLERALPNLRLVAAHFKPLASGGGGAVSFVSRAQGTFSGELVIGDLVVPGTGAKYKGDVELTVVCFDEEGLLRSLSTGVIVPESAVAADAELAAALAAIGDSGAAESAGPPEEDEAILEMRRRVESQAQKLRTTPEGTMAWEKITSDMAATQAKLDAFQREGELVRTSGGHGGLGGILFALGVEHQGSGGAAVSLDGLGGGWVELDDISMELDLISMPTECETLLQEQQKKWGEVMSKQ